MITDQELDLLEKNRQKDSDWILQRINLLPILSKFGEVKIAGAKALGLMLAKDIDMSVIVPEVKMQDWQALVNELMITPFVRNVSAIDCYNYDEQNHYDPVNGQKYSLFISINNILGPEDDKYDTWDCQIHLLKSDVFDENKIIGVQNKLTPEKRILVLRIKYWANLVNTILKAETNGNYKILSPSIYKAVLENGIHKIHDFNESFTPSVPEKFKQSYFKAVDQIGTDY